MTENPNTQPDPTAGRPPEPGAEQPGPAAQTPPAPPASGTPQSPESQPTEQVILPGEPAPSQTSDSAAASAAIGPQGATEDPWTDVPDDETIGEPVDPYTPDTGVAATFLPGIEAGSLLALLLALLGAGSYLLVYPLVQAHGASRTWSDFKNNVPRARQDPFGTERDWISYQSWSMIILGLAAILVALLILGMWTAQRNRLYSRVFAQSALVLGLAVVLYGILMKTGAVGAQIPSMKEISSGLSSQQ